MSSNESLNLLIAKAGAIAKSEYKLAKALGVRQSHLSMWKSGKKSCTPPDRARLAGFARAAAVQELARSTVEQNAGTLRSEQLRKLLGKALHQTGVANVTELLRLASLICGTLILDIPRCIKSLNRKRLSYLC